MTFSPVKFLGASVYNVQSNVAYGSSPSVLTISLVEDTKDGDAFTYPSPGGFYLFALGSLSFYGILKSYRNPTDSSGSNTFEVILEDPREVLNGVDLILGDYSGSVAGIPNVLNIYGYWESTGYGNSGRNNAGIPWKKIRDGITAIFASGNTTYGNYIALGSVTYGINMNGLPSLPDDYRISQTNMTLLEYISEICEAANYDFFFRGSLVSGQPYIDLITVNRNIRPVSGAIAGFIAITDGAVSKEVGFELSTDVTSKFLVGGQQEYFYTNTLQDETPGNRDEPIAPFWGFDTIGRAVIDRVGKSSSRQFTLNSFGVAVANVADGYPSDIQELRYVKRGINEWMSFLSYMNNFLWTPDPDGQFYSYQLDPFLYYVGSHLSYTQDLEGLAESLRPENPDDTIEIDVNTVDIYEDYHEIIRDITRPGKYYDKDVSPSLDVPLNNRTRYRHNGEINPHFGKSDLLSMVGLTLSNLLIGLKDKEGGLDKLNYSDFVPLDAGAIAKANGNSGTTQPQDHEILHKFLEEFATGYMGKKFMVKIPDIIATYDTSTEEWGLNREPASSAYLPENLWDDAIANNILPVYYSKLLDNDNKFYCYVRIDEAELYDFSEINEDDLIIDIRPSTSKLAAKKGSARTKTALQTRKAYIKCEVEVGKVVYYDTVGKTDPRAVITLPGTPTVKHNASTEQIASGFGLLLQAMNETFPSSKALHEGYIKALAGRPGGDQLALGIEAQPKFPDQVFIPIKSNVERYGPWTAVGANAKTAFEIDDSLVPWNYGGYTNLNAAANAKVTSALNEYLIQEGGSVVVPGVPIRNLGDQLISAGPYITNISVSFGRDISTTYQMNTWKPHPYKLRKEREKYLDKIGANAKKAIQQASRLRDEVARKVLHTNPIKRGEKSAWSEVTSSHSIILSEIVSGQVTTSIQPAYNTAGQIFDNYVNKGAVSLEGLFVPFSTHSGEETQLPYLVQNPSGTAPTVAELNSYELYNPASIVPWGHKHSGLFSSQIPSGEIGVRPVALRSPLFLCGWGYDVNGNLTTPSGDDPTQWKVGPLDARWNEERGVWEAGNGGEGASAPDSPIIIQSTTPGSGQRVWHDCTRYKPQYTSTNAGEAVNLVAQTGVYKVANFRTNYILGTEYHLAYLVKTTGGDSIYVLDNQMTFIDFGLG